MIILSINNSSVQFFVVVVVTYNFFLAHTQINLDTDE